MMMSGDITEAVAADPVLADGYRLARGTDRLTPRALNGTHWWDTEERVGVVFAADRVTIWMALDPETHHDAVETTWNIDYRAFVDRVKDGEWRRVVPVTADPATVEGVVPSHGHSEWDADRVDAAHETITEGGETLEFDLDQTGRLHRIGAHAGYGTLYHATRDGAARLLGLRPAARFDLCAESDCIRDRKDLRSRAEELQPVDVQRDSVVWNPVPPADPP